MGLKVTNGNGRRNYVKRNEGTDEPGYSFPSASAQEVWVHHVPRTAKLEKLTDPRLARCSACQREPR